MPKYSFFAKSPKGEEKSDILEAKDERQLAAILKSQGFVLIKAKLEKKLSQREKFNLPLPFFGGVSLVEKMTFTRNLQVMISAGLPLPKALEILSVQAQSKKFKKALLEIKENVIKGENFSETLAKYENIFSELYQNMIKVGEESGTLDNVLKILSRQMEKEHELKSKITGALMYPTVIILAMIGIGILMLITVVPKLSETFRELGVELPLTTRIVLFLGNFLAEKWYFCILIIIFIFFFFWTAMKKEKTKKIIDILTLKMPIVSVLIKKTNSAFFARTLSSLTASGVPIVRSLEIVSGTMGNIYFKRTITEAMEKVRKGEKLSEALKIYQNIYPPIVSQMIKVGEETGETTSILAKLADFFEEEVGNATKNLSSIIEPVLMLIIGAAIGFFAVSMIQPMYSMLGAI